MTVHTLRSRNPHADCHLFPCAKCQAKRDDEQAARDRHPAGSDVATTDVTRWDCYATGGSRVVLDLVAGLIDDEWLNELDHRLSAWREVRDEVAGQRLGELEPEDYEHQPLLVCIDDVRDHLRVSINRERCLAIALALQNHASRMEH